MDTSPSPALARSSAVRPRFLAVRGWGGTKNADHTSSSPTPTPSPTSAPISAPAAR